MTRQTFKGQYEEDGDDDWRPVGGGGPHLFLNITTEDVDDCFVETWWEADGAVSPASNLLLTLHSNIVTKMSVRVHIHTWIYVYIHVLYIEMLFVMSWKFLLSIYWKKKNTPSLLNLHSSPSLFPANGQAALNVGRILWWYCFSVCFCFVFTLLKGCDTSLAPPIAL